ncbi:winged helix-turn-helix domain-containing protein [Roseateles amylovorans]|uniref:Helix-turn-helix domain-containing protein n=1 Tax=Roseateles amylovorans TaxID=2978473 RepID=A0ABY6AU46_9BURK|nr:helix-turn-helix domain-containing protein [Roseateles amylovorans]UXH76741.1 helix-turn-helix domain-containing protein [Roseateles amylovorans]
MTQAHTPQFNARAIRDPAHIRLLSSPVRHELADTLASMGGEATVATLAEQMGRPADGLYYHLQLLVDGGLVHERQGDHGERIFTLAGDGQAPLRLSYDLASDEARQALASYAKGLLQVAESDFLAGLKLGAIDVEGPRRRLWAARNRGWVSPAELEEANALLERLCELLSHPRDASRDVPMSLAFVLAPTVIRQRRRSSGKTDAD